jgi:large subunit ribosomal protein L24e
MPKCAFCGNQVEKGTGKMFIYNSGKNDYFCSNKCEKNLLVLKRKPLKIRWTEAYRKEHKKGLKEEAPIAKKAVTESKDSESSAKPAEPKVEEAPKVEAKVEETTPKTEEQKPVEEVKEVTESKDSKSSAKPAEPKAEDAPKAEEQKE